MHIDERRHAGVVAIVTGAASGIGRATALRLAREGARVVAADVSGAIGTLVDALGDATGTIAVVPTDITDQADVDALVAQAEALGPIQAVANVAGIMDHFVPLHELDDDLWYRVLDVNVTGAMRICRRVLPAMIERGHGSIVNVASRAAVLGGGAGSAYATSKHALVGLTRSVAARYARNGVRCNAVCPGGVATGIGSTAAPHDPAELQGWAAVFAAMPRTAEPDEIAAVVSWLSSAEASNLSGAIVAADTGWSAM